MLPGNLTGGQRLWEFVSLYGRMQFADYVVSHALQMLTRSLLRVAEQSGGVSESDLKAIAQTARRLLSLWQMVQLSVGRLHYESARRDLRQILKLAEWAAPTPEIRAGQQLQEHVDTRTREDLQRLLHELLLAENIRQGQPPGNLRDRLSCLLQDESARWRDYPALRQIRDKDLLEHGIGRAYARSANLTAKLDRINALERGSISPKRLLRVHRWVSHCVNHLELLRPALSDAGRTRRWHLDRLAAKLESQRGLEILTSGLEARDLKRKSKARIEAAIETERRRLEKQRQKLSRGSFVGGAGEFHAEAVLAIKQLGLKEIALLPTAVRAVAEAE